MTEGSCFVMQPFDRGKFDQRYVDTFAPAIVEADLKPYRVDEDPSASIPIEEVEKQIRHARVCFAEITTDNPNVWFELGFALACKKEVCLVCSTERVGKFPFDVQHRQIIRYNTNSSSDFNRLQKDITQRLQAILSKSDFLDTMNSEGPLLPTAGLSHAEITTLVLVLENRLDPSASLGVVNILQDMERLGYTKVAVQLTLEKLRRKTFISSEVETIYEEQYNHSYDMTHYRITEQGVEWLLENENQIQIRYAPKMRANARRQDKLDDDMPF